MDYSDRYPYLDVQNVEGCATIQNGRLCVSVRLCDTDTKAIQVSVYKNDDDDVPARVLLIYPNGTITII